MTLGERGSVTTRVGLWLADVISWYCVNAQEPGTSPAWVSTSLAGCGGQWDDKEGQGHSKAVFLKDWDVPRDGWSVSLWCRPGQVASLGICKHLESAVCTLKESLDLFTLGRFHLFLLPDCPYELALVSLAYTELGCLVIHLEVWGLQKMTSPFLSIFGTVTPSALFSQVAYWARQHQHRNQKLREVNFRNLFWAEHPYRKQLKKLPTE